MDRDTKITIDTTLDLVEENKKPIIWKDYTLVISFAVARERFRYTQKSVCGHVVFFVTCHHALRPRRREWPKKETEGPTHR